MEALIALAGVVVGALVAGLVDYFVQRQRTDEAVRREAIESETAARAAALLVAMELAEEEAALLEGFDDSVESSRHPAWSARRELLARHLGPVSAFPVALVFSLIDRTRAASGPRREQHIRAARELFEFCRVDILMAYAARKPLPDDSMVDAALVAAGSPALSHWIRRRDTVTDSPRADPPPP